MTTTTEKTDERYHVNDHDLHIYSDAEDDWEVWLNTEVADFDGLCVGSGDSREKALADAAETLEAAARILRAGCD